MTTKNVACNSFCPGVVGMLRRTVVVTGASRGLGLEMVKQLVKNPERQPSRNPTKVIATCRNPESCPDLLELASEEKDRLFVKALDVLNYDSFGDFVNNDVKACNSYNMQNVVNG